MRSVALDIAEELEANSGLNLAVGTNLFVSKKPDKPLDDPAGNAPRGIVVIYDTGGEAPSAKLAIDEKAAFMVQARSVEYNDGYEIMDRIKSYLNGHAGFKAQGEAKPDPSVVPPYMTNYVGIWASSNIAFLTYDERNLAMFSCNYMATREPDDRQSGNRQPV